jgi:hypothetical protein
MLKVRFAIASLGFAMMLPTVPALNAQTTGTAAAPLPSQILTAKKVFISNAGGDFGSYSWSGGPARTYNEFYAAIKGLGRYELSTAPADADLVLQISYAAPIRSVASGSSYVSPQFRVVLLDPKTRIALWALVEDTSIGNGSQKGRDKNYEEALNKLVEDLKTLIAQPAATSR